MTGIIQSDKHKIIGVIKAVIPEAKIILYGSRARGDFTDRSDIDIALQADQQLSRADIAEIKDMLENSSIPYHFDIVDLETIPKNLKEIILKEGIKWND